MFDRFTQDAKMSMNAARVASQRLNHGYLGTEHILLGLLDVSDCRALNILAAARVDPGILREQVERLIKPGPSLESLVQIPFTARAMKVLELSLEAAGKLKDTYIGTAHLLLGLVDEGEGVAARALREAGLTSESAFTIARDMESRDDDLSVSNRKAAAEHVLTNVSSPPSRPLQAATLLRMAKDLLIKNGQFEAAHAVDKALRLLESEN